MLVGSPRVPQTGALQQVDGGMEIKARQSTMPTRQIERGWQEPSGAGHGNPGCAGETRRAAACNADRVIAAHSGPQG
jgi:hypothetical protein